jgi:hypothetical protein
MTPAHGRERFFRSIARSMRRLRYLTGYALPRALAGAVLVPAPVRVETRPDRRAY